MSFQAALLAMCCAAGALGQTPTQTPTLTGITPSARTDLTTGTVPVTLTGTGFTDSMTLEFTPPGMIVTGALTQTGGVSATVTFRLTKQAFGSVNVAVQVGGATSPKPLPFDTGVQCLEALPSGGCELRWEFEAAGASGKSGQNNTIATHNTVATPNMLAVLDYQWHAPQDPKVRNHDAAARQTARDRLATHLVFKTGYTQAISASKVQPVGNTAGTATAASTAAIPQPAFEVEAGGTLGWTIGRDGQGGVFTELGFGARGSFQDLLANNQIFQSGGLNYVYLAVNNPQSVAGLYEGTAHFKVASWNHNQAASTGGRYHNVSNLLVIEAGYQNNSGLQQLLATNPQTNTRNRFVGRVYLSPEIPNTSHTKVTLGMEYSGGMNGGPKIVQIFLGTNLNLATLLRRP